MSDSLATIPLSAIRVFEAAARLLSFTQAAAELGISQAAVSWQVKALERRLDQTLFHRSSRAVSLTPAGERLARAATEAMAGLRSAISDLTDSGEGVLAITTLQTLATQWLAPRLGAFQLAHPRIAVRLEASHRVVDLSREPFDVAIRGGGGSWPDLEAIKLFDAAITPLCTPATREALGGLASPTDLLDAPRIGATSEWAQWFASAGVTPPDGDSGAIPRLAAEAQAMEVAAALGGRVVALGSPIMFAAEIASGRLVQPFAALSNEFGAYWLAYPRDRARARKIAAFRDWVLAEVAADPTIVAL